MDLLTWLQHWYADQCDGEWEEFYGVEIRNVDNPGWVIHIDLTHTGMENKPFTEIRDDNGDDDWIFCQVRNDPSQGMIFHGAGDPNKLVKILTVFRNWVENE